MPQHIQSWLKEEWQQQFQYFEQQRNDLLLEHQRMQKRSPKLQSLQDKKEGRENNVYCDLVPSLEFAVASPACVCGCRRVVSALVRVSQTKEADQA